MHIIRRVFAILIGLLALVVLVVCVAGVVGVWYVQKPLLDRTKRTVDESSRALEGASTGVAVVHDSLTKARQDLGDFRAASRKAEGGKPTLEHRLIAQQIDSRIQNAGATVNTVTDAAVVLNSLLDGLNQLPETSIPTLDTDRLKEVQGSLTDLTNSSRQFGVLLNQDGMNNADAEAARIDDLLVKVIDLVADLRGKLSQLQSDVSRLQERTPRWIHRGSLVITAVLSWIAVSQIFVLGYAVYWLRNGTRTAGAT